MYTHNYKFLAHLKKTQKCERARLSFLILSQVIKVMLVYTFRPAF